MSCRDGTGWRDTRAQSLPEPEGHKTRGGLRSQHPLYSVSPQGALGRPTTRLVDTDCLGTQVPVLASRAVSASANERQPFDVFHFNLQPLPLLGAQRVGPVMVLL